MVNLWSENHPARFWGCQSEATEDYWQTALQSAIPVLGLSPQPRNPDDLLALILGEEQFGANHWRLSIARRIYFTIKPYIPRSITRYLRQAERPAAQNKFPLGWPIEDRYVRFLWEIRQQVSKLTNGKFVFSELWPEGLSYALVLTHDIETAEGQAYAKSVADQEESYGFRSSYNFIPERYPLDLKFIEDLLSRGFEIGIHGLKHDGKLYNSYKGFLQRAIRINTYLKELGAVGFRSPLMMRNPEWLQALDIEYDLSFFDTDPFEPIPGGVMSIWPFILGRFVELPYTLVQDYTLTAILGESTPKFWLDKVDFIAQYQGMALVNTHPDYLRAPLNNQIYSEFLQTMKNRTGYWHALPKDVARWWRTRLGLTTC